MGILPQVDSVVDEGNQMAVAGMSDSETELLIDLLQRLIANLEREAASEDAGLKRSEST